MAVKDALNGLPRQLTNAIGDIGRIAEGMQTLPALLEALERIDTHVVSLDQEVKKMRAAVERLEDGVGVMDGKLDEVAQTLHPVRRAFRRRSSS